MITRMELNKLTDRLLISMVWRTNRATRNETDNITGELIQRIGKLGNTKMIEGVTQWSSKRVKQRSIKLAIGSVVLVLTAVLLYSHGKIHREIQRGVQTSASVTSELKDTCKAN